MVNMNFSTEGMVWLENLAQDVDLLSGYYQSPEAAAIYCETCDTVQAYCRGCGLRLLDVYNEQSHSCENCGISLAHCNICGSSVIELAEAPVDAEPPEYWKYCPACGEGIFNTVEMCPYCKTRMGAFLDTVYQETIQNVSRAVSAAERGEGYMENIHEIPSTYEPPEFHLKASIILILLIIFIMVFSIALDHLFLS